ncbi:hypothetical protein ACMGT0_08840 [Pseudomonas sp. RHF3.3-3]|uniref:hypothetical protein n=1 Tax=Pseudomonas sp. RHF3.3-3 TaxID=3396624 RepID=UPI003A87C8F3
MSTSIARKVLGPVFLLLGLLSALPASANVIVSCTGTLDGALDPGLTSVAAPQVGEVQASIVSSATCTLVGTTVQPARLELSATVSSGSCTGFTLNPGSTNMTITWDDNSTSAATFAPSNPLTFLLPGPLAGSFLITSGHAAGHTMVITGVPSISAALAACLLPGAAPVRHLGFPISFVVI